MDQTTIFLIIVGMGVVTYVPRVLPPLFLASRPLPPVVSRWLGYVPVAVLSAMLFPSLFLKERAFTVGFDNLFFWAAIPTLLVAIFSRSLFASVITGMALVAGARFFFGM
jgi:branched-subunit amino acid transport protein